MRRVSGFAAEIRLAAGAYGSRASLASGMQRDELRRVVELSQISVYEARGSGRRLMERG